MCHWNQAVLMLAGIVSMALPVMGGYRENIEYGRAGGQSLRMDARVPEGSGPFPAAIIVHGGAWVAGDRKTSVEPLFQPLTQAGFAWFSISYRLAAPRNGSLADAVASAMGLNDSIEDVGQAIAYVKTHAAEFHVNPDRIALIGESAGGQLASMAALKPGLNGSVRAVVVFYSPSDLVALARTSKQIPDSVRDAFKGTPWEAMLIARLRELSPVNWIHKDGPRFLLIHGTADTLVPYEQSVEMCRKLREAGDDCDLYSVHGGGHGILWWESVHLTAYKHYMVRWLEAQLQPAPGVHRHT